MNQINIERLIIIGIALFLSFHAGKIFYEINDGLNYNYMPDIFIIKFFILMLIPVETLIFFTGCLKIGQKIILRDEW